MSTTTIARTAAIAAAVIALMALALPGLASAKGLAKTKVTINAQNATALSGTVKSKRSDCREERQLKVYMLVGQLPNPAADTEIGTATTSQNGKRFEWAVANPNAPTGLYYAYAAPVPFCKSGTSRTLSLLGK